MFDDVYFFLCYFGKNLYVSFSLGFFFKYLLFYIEQISSKLIKVNNRFSQNIVDRLVAIKLIRINNMEEKEKNINKKILKDQ